MPLGLRKLVFPVDRPSQDVDWVHSAGFPERQVRFELLMCIRSTAYERC